MCIIDVICYSATLSYALPQLEKTDLEEVERDWKNEIVEKDMLVTRFVV